MPPTSRVRPARIAAHLRRRLRNRTLRAAATDHIEFYRAVIDDNAERDPDRAIGSPTREHWLELGQQQLDYLLAHGLAPQHRLLDVGCGNLRGGRLLIDYLDRGHYVGTDISSRILLEAQRTIADFGLQAKMPYLFLVRDMRFEMFPDDYFDVVHAYSVFTISPLNVVEECFANVGRVMRPNGLFDFTYRAGESRSYVGEEFWHPTEAIVALAERNGFKADVMSDWPHPSQTRMRLRLGG